VSDDPDLARLLAMKAGKLKHIGMDEKVDLRELSKDGKTPTFHVIKKVNIDNFEKKLDAVNPQKADAAFFQDGAHGMLERLKASLSHVSDDEVEKEAVRINAILEEHSIENHRRAGLVQRAFERLKRKEKLKALREKYTEKQQQLTEAQRRLKRAEARSEIWEINKSPVLQRLGETGMHKIMEAAMTSELILAGMPEGTRSAFQKEVRGGHTFVVQHDWAAAFAKSTDIHEGEIRVPYEKADYEFRISGHRVVLCADGKEGMHNWFAMFIELASGEWALASLHDWEHGKFHLIEESGSISENIFALCWSQIRAMCLALDMEVAETEVVRAPHKLNQKREHAGKLPIYDYHIVNLAHRTRYAARLPEPGEVENDKRHPRLHIVRGHWRHYPNHKAWIKAFLRGNPDLGFIDKEYRL
jgi:hypothetical protein